jgi:hypothetical protein
MSQLIEDWWDTARAAQYLGMPERTLERWRVDDYGPPYARWGKRVKYCPDLVREWAQQQIVYPDAA